jgi:hydrogenase maturation protease
MIKIGGVGSVLLSDDGVGPYVVRTLAAQYEFPSDVEIEDLGTPGLDLIAHITGMDTLILVDAVKNGTPAGTVTPYYKEDITKIRPAVRMDPHSPALTESLFLAEMGGGAPENVLLIGISGESYEVGENLSDPVRAAVPRVIEMILKELERFGIQYKKKEVPDPNPVWWEATPIAVQL